jgi:hypothetical protein
MSILTSSLVAYHTPLLVMARDSDRDKHPWSEGSSHDAHQLPSRRGEDGHWASLLTKWGFSPWQQLNGLASHGDVDRGLMVDVGLVLLRAQQRWRWCWMSYRSSSSLGRGSCTGGKVPSLHEKMVWWLLIVPLII